MKWILKFRISMEVLKPANYNFILILMPFSLMPVALSSAFAYVIDSPLMIGWLVGSPIFMVLFVIGFYFLMLYSGDRVLKYHYKEYQKMKTGEALFWYFIFLILFAMFYAIVYGITYFITY